MYDSYGFHYVIDCTYDEEVYVAAIGFLIQASIAEMKMRVKGQNGHFKNCTIPMASIM